MGRCTAVEILALGGMRDNQRLPLLEEVWNALTDEERETIADRLHDQRYKNIAARMHGVHVTAGAHDDWGDVGTEAGS